MPHFTKKTFLLKKHIYILTKIVSMLLFLEFEAQLTILVV